MKRAPRIMAFLLAGLPATWAQAQPAARPDGPIKLIVPFAPGGGVDTAAWLIARQLQVNTGPR